WGGQSKLFKQIENFGIFELDGSNAYPEIEEYSRTMFLIGGEDQIKGDNKSYVVDIFRVRGGEDHVYSFHGPPGELTAVGLNLKPQNTGTYAGENIAKGAWATDFPIGYSHLYNVKKEMNPPSQFILDWKAETGFRGIKENDDIHIRLHAISQSGEVALADGDPPQNKPGNPKKLSYALIHNKGENLQSTFVSVIEPYRDDPFIHSVTRLDKGKDMGIAIQVERQEGILESTHHNPTTAEQMKIPDGPTLSGAAAYLQLKGGKVHKAVIVNGKILKFQNMKLKSSGPITGKILQMNRELKGGGWLILDQLLPTDGS